MTSSFLWFAGGKKAELVTFVSAAPVWRKSRSFIPSFEVSFFREPWNELAVAAPTSLG